MSKLSATMILAIKKIGVSVLGSDLIAGVIRKAYNNKIPHYNRTVYTDSPIISNRITGMIYFKAYESSEIRFVQKHLLKNLPVVELGASIGVMAMQIANATSQQIYSVEANPELIPVIKNNLEKNNVTNCTVLNYIIATSGEQLYFLSGDDNTTGSVVNTKSNGAVLVKSLSLTDLLSEINVKDYILVCDIEGAEIYILRENIDAFKNCRQIIIELHDTNYGGKPVAMDEMENLIKQAGFSIVDAYGPNIVFERK